MTIENKEESAKLWILVFLYKTPSDAQELAYHGCSTMIRGKFNGKEFSDLLTNDDPCRISWKILHAKC